MRLIFARVALVLFLVYVALFPGSTLTVALDQVPEWGIWFGAGLLVLQGATVLAWLGWRYGGHGLVGGLTVGLLGFAVEYVGVNSGFPFGRYAYTAVLQPQIAGVPLAICCAWVMAAPSSYEIARLIAPARWEQSVTPALTATLVLLLDLQIETVAAYINNYWIWLDRGPYYGVPTANFVAWWLVGLVMALVMTQLVGSQQSTVDSQQPATSIPPRPPCSMCARLTPYLPHLLYLMSTLMFSAVNLAHGYLLAGLIGLVVLVGAAALTIRSGDVAAARRVPRRRFD